MKRHAKIRFRLHCDSQKITGDDEWQTSLSSDEPIDNPAKFQRLIFDELNFVEAIQDICGVTWRDKATMIQYDTLFWVLSRNLLVIQKLLVKKSFMNTPEFHKNIIMRLSK